MDITAFEKLWLDCNPDKASQAEFWDERAESFNNHKKNNGDQQNRQDLINFISEECRLNGQSSVLDIGCGAGHYALPFAKVVKEVVAFDLSPKMIKLSEENMAAEGLSNIDFQVLDWETVDLKTQGWENKFDLVVASRTPAINNRKSLEKMMAASKDHCLFISMVEQRHSVRDTLKDLFPEPESKLDKTCCLVFNILWLMGYYPRISYLDNNWECDSSLEESILIHTGYFAKNNPLSITQKETLAKRLSEMTLRGLIHEKSEAKLAIIRWAV